MGHIQFEVTAGGWVYNDHDGDTLRVEVTDQAGTLIWVFGVQLNQMGAFSDFTLDGVGVGVDLSHLLLLLLTVVHLLLLLHF